MRMQRVVFVALCVVLLVSGVAYAENSERPPAFSNVKPWDYDLGPVFQAASAKYNVPLPLLLALGHFGSAFENRGDARTIENGYGVMALRKNDMGGTSLADAAALTGVSEEDLKVNANLNIMGAAAVLDAYAKQLQINRSAGIDEWLDVVIKYAAIDKLDAENPVPVFSRLFAMEVFQKLQSGVATINSMGESFSAAPQNIGKVDLAALNLQGLPRTNVTGYSGATWYPAATCNYSTTRYNKSIYAIHTIEGSAAGCLSWFRNCSAQCSANYVVSEAGGIWQCVDEVDMSWHVTCMNYCSIGTEHEGYAASASHPTALYNASALVVRDACNRWGIPKSHSPCSHSILGHVDINNCWCGPGHWDPGAGWDWNYFINAVNGTTYINPPYLFGDGANGWTAGNSVWSNGLVHTGSNWGGSIYFDQTGSDCYIFSPETNFTGSSPMVLNVNVYPQSGASANHDMQLHWRTAAEGSFAADKASPIAYYQAQNAWATVNLYINNAKWSGQTVKQLRLDFDNNNQSTRYIVNHVVLQNGLYWPFNSDTNGWTVGNSLSAPWHTASGWPGCLVTDQTGSDSYMYSPTLSGTGFPYNYIGGENDWIKVRVYPQNPTTSAHDLRVYWIHSSDSTWSDTKSCSVTYNAKNEWADVYVPVGATGIWAGQHITRLRVDFDQNNQNTRWIVDEISGAQLGKDTTAPTVPSGLAATSPAGNTVSLSWTASTDATGVNGYKIYRNGTQIGTSISPAYTDSTVQPQTTYSYTVSAYDAVGNNSAQCAAKNVTTAAPDLQAPTVPQNLRRTAVAKTSITLAWDASTDNVGVTGYRVYRNGTQVGTATGTSYNDTGLSENTGYTYQVDAYDAKPNYSAKSAPLDTGTAATWTRSNASQTCYTRSGSKDVCGQGGVAVGFSAMEVLQTRRGLVQWDMTGAPTTNETMDAANSVRIRMYQYSQFNSTASADISLYKVNNDWDETNGTWNNVGIGAKYAGATTACVNTGDYLWSFNGRTQGVPPANRGVFVKNDTNEADAAFAKIFDNRENIGGSGKPPRLEIDYVDLTAPVNCSVKINGGASHTKTAAVTLTLAATDYLSGMSQMAFSSDGVNYSAAEAYAATKSYALPSGDGAKTVYAKFRDKVGNWSAAVSAAIVLDTVAPTISIGAPSVSTTANGPVSYEITYGGADQITLAGSHVTLNKTGSAAAGSVVVSGTGATNRTVTISDITGSGALGISIASGTASDAAGNLAAAMGPSVTFAVSGHIDSYGLSNKAAWDSIIGNVPAGTVFTLWGKVIAPIDSDSFYIDDGSGMPVKVNFAGHSFTTADYVSATGTLDSSGAAPILNALAVKKQN